MSTFKQDLIAALKRIDRPGSFCVTGSLPAVMPGLEVAKLGPVGLPLNTSLAEELKTYCEQAPYGKGEATLVDTSVRRVWHMPAEKFALTNPAWEKFVEQMVKHVQEGLGLDNQKVESHIYDLLLYEPGSFFLPHRDSEKLDRMVATLVVVLPSSYQGGELIVRHDGKEQVIDFSGENKFDIHYAAFYADCEHEIRPLSKGHRLCLVYNLTLAKKSKTPIIAPRFSDHVETISEILRGWERHKDIPDKLAITLDHQYTRDGLTWDALKGIDRAKANVLLEAARKADCFIYLAMLTFHESGSAEYTGSRWSEDEYEMEEVFESTLSAGLWLDPDGKQLGIGEMQLEEEEVLDFEAIQKIEPEEQFEGYTGNEGMTLDRWYRHGAIFLWPANRHFEVLSDVGTRQALPILESMGADWKKTPRKEADTRKADCIKFAAAIISKWSSLGEYSDSKKGIPCPMMALLEELDDPELVRAYLRNAVARDNHIEPGKPLAAVCEKHGWDAFRAQLEGVFSPPAPVDPSPYSQPSYPTERNARLLQSLCLAKPRKKAGWLDLCTGLANTLVSIIEKEDREAATASHYRAKDPRGNELVADLAQSLIATEQFDLLDRFVTHMLDTPLKYPLTEVQVAALTSLQPWLKKNVKTPCPPLSRWISACCKQLEAQTVAIPQPPPDLRRTANFRCKCGDCLELRKFLDSPTDREHRFRVREDRRSHLRSSISQGQCDVNTRTERTSNPHILVCAKNTASYEVALKKYHLDREHLAALQTIAAALPK